MYLSRCLRALPVRFYTQKATKRKPAKVSIQSLSRTLPPADSAAFIQTLRSSQPSNVPPGIRPVVSVTVGETIDLGSIGLALGPWPVSTIVPHEVVNVSHEGRDLMVLANGTLVGWGIPEHEMVRKLVPLVAPAVSEPYEPELEEMDYVDVDAADPEWKKVASSRPGSFMADELILIQGLHSQKLLDKAAFAIGLSRSTRLSILEMALEKHITLTRSNSVALSLGSPITTTESDVLKLTGRLFLLRGKLNLYSELIETPDLYWTEPNLEKIYESISRTLDILPRIAILNRKLDYATEEQRALLSVLNEKKGTRLEWIIILLIMVEVCFELFHFYENYVEKQKSAR